MASFVDRVVLHVTAGDGGHGCASIHREKFKPLGGPDGGNGGGGGDVTLVVEPGAHTLLDFHHRPHQRAESGRPGQGGHRNGAAGAAVKLAVPNGTIVKTEGGEVLADLVGNGTRYVIAHGGQGGLGNAALANARRRAPGFALRGEPGQAVDVLLELASVADVGLVGFPSAGKSSLIAAISAARPKIADYPFTTLAPNLGVVSAGDTVFTVADVPGLIPGAAQGRGLGLEFLRHVERCAVLVHVVDAATLEPGRDPLADIAAIEAELAAYTGTVATRLADRPRVAVLNKVDVPEAAELAAFVRPELAASGLAVFEVSAVTHQGLRELCFALADRVVAERVSHPPAAPTRIVLRPPELGGPEFTVTRDPLTEGGYLVTGAKPERWVRQTDFANDEAVGYLADRLARIGIEDELGAVGARAGDPVRIGDVAFDWAPSGVEDTEFVPGDRGRDERLDPNTRVRAEVRREAKRARRRRTQDAPPAGDAVADADALSSVEE